MPDTEKDRSRAKKEIPRTESELQPDPMLRPRTGGTVWAWVIGIAIVVILAFVFYGINLRGQRPIAQLPPNGAAAQQTPTTIGQAPPPAASATTGQGSTAGQ